MDLPFDKSKKNNKEPHLIPLKRKSLTETDKTIYHMCNRLKNSLIKECFINLFSEEKDPPPTLNHKKLSPYLKNISIGDIKLCEDTTDLIDINYFKQKLEKTLNQMGLLENKELAKYSLNVEIMHCMNVSFNINEDDSENPFKYMVRTNLMAKYTTIRKSDGKMSCELWYQGKGDKEAFVIDDKIKRETLEMAYNDNLNYILEIIKGNIFQ